MAEIDTPVKARIEQSERLGSKGGGGNHLVPGISLEQEYRLVLHYESDEYQLRKTFQKETLTGVKLAAESGGGRFLYSLGGRWFLVFREDRLYFTDGVSYEEKLPWSELPSFVEQAAELAVNHKTIAGALIVRDIFTAMETKPLPQREQFLIETLDMSRQQNKYWDSMYEVLPKKSKRKVNQQLEAKFLGQVQSSTVSPRVVDLLIKREADSEQFLTGLQKYLASTEPKNKLLRQARDLAWLAKHRGEAAARLACDALAVHTNQKDRIDLKRTAPFLSFLRSAQLSCPSAKKLVAAMGYCCDSEAKCAGQKQYHSAEQALGKLLEGANPFSSRSYVLSYLIDKKQYPPTPDYIKAYQRFSYELKQDGLACATSSIASESCRCGIGWVRGAVCRDTKSKTIRLEHANCEFDIDDQTRRIHQVRSIGDSRIRAKIQVRPRTLLCLPQNEPFTKKRYAWFLDKKRVIWTDIKGQTVPWQKRYLNLLKDESGSLLVQGQAAKSTSQIECEVTFEPPPHGALQKDKYYQERPSYYVKKTIRSKPRALNDVWNEMQSLKPLPSRGLFR